jgi:hypothetical protein
VTLKVSFDIGGVLTKHPDQFRKMIRALRDGGAEVYVITDIPDHQRAIRLLRDNDMPVTDDNVVCANYAMFGDECKARAIELLGIDIHVDDHPGYCAHDRCVSLLAWPQPKLPYYADEFITDGSEGDFGRRKK